MNSTEIPTLTYRKLTIEKMKTEEFDIVVVGGGITGAGIARDAVLRGYSVALIDKNDFGYGTSSGSSKIVHAGFRYLITKEFRLVREGSVERKKILEMAPHLTRPLKFLFPLHSDTYFTKSKLRKGGWLYDLMAGFRNYFFHKIISPKKALSMLPSPIREENFQGAALIGDGQMDDARLTLDVILSAEEHGANVLNYCQFEVLNEDPSGNVQRVSVVDKLSDEKFQIKTRSVVLACGHWTDEVIQTVDSSASKRIRPTKGIHVITRRFYNKDYAVVVPVEDGRIIFLVPFGENLLIGTTDTDYSGDHDNVPVNKEDVTYLINAVNFIFPDSLREEDVISAYSGLRPLIISPESESESEVSRKHKIFHVKPNVYAIAGGKFTTYRAMAKELVDNLTNLLGKRGKCRTDKIPLYGWLSTKRKDWDNWAIVAIENLTIRYQIPMDVAQHLMRYGKNYLRICEEMDLDPSSRNRISKDRPYILAEIDYQIKYEKAVTLYDIMLRRTQLQLSDEQGLDCVDIIANRMSRIFKWSSVKVDEEIAKYQESLVWRS